MSLAQTISAVQQALLTDPQTAGGLLVSCTPHVVEQVLALFRDEGFFEASVIGEMQAGIAGVEVV